MQKIMQWTFAPKRWCIASSLNILLSNYRQTVKFSLLNKVQSWIFRFAVAVSPWSLRKPTWGYHTMLRNSYDSRGMDNVWLWSELLKQGRRREEKKRSIKNVAHFTLFFSKPEGCVSLLICLLRCCYNPAIARCIRSRPSSSRARCVPKLSRTNCLPSSPKRLPAFNATFASLRKNS